MINRQVDQAIEGVPGLREGGQSVARALHQAVLAGGPPTRRLADLLHGVWLGHPLHPVLTDIVVGAWVLGSLFDFLAARGGRNRRLERAADMLVELGTVAAVPTALTGLTDFSAAPRGAMAPAAAHGLLNSAALVSYVGSIAARRAGNRGLGVFFSGLGLAIATLSAYLGGHLVFAKRVGTNHSQPGQQPEKWTPVMAEEALKEGEPRCVEVEGTAVLLYRQANKVYAIGAICGHAGGPLHEGKFDGLTVQCPWHDSVYDLRDGTVIHGPSTYQVPPFEAQIRQGQIRLRRAAP
jgi:nitrite reductase/ring-hydroxylating ferredoxin subunit/uncharacterized membrane protein